MPHPTVTISRSRDGPVYAGTTFELRVNISFTDLTMDIALAISWKRSNNITGNAAIGNDNRTTVSSISGGGDSYSSTLIYSPIAISDSGNITAIVTINLSSSNESLCAQIKASDTEQLTVEGIYIMLLFSLITSVLSRIFGLGGKLCILPQKILNFTLPEM